MDFQKRRVQFLVFIVGIVALSITAEKCRQLVGDDYSSQSGKFTIFNCFDMSSGTLACAKVSSGAVEPWLVPTLEVFLFAQGEDGEVHETSTYANFEVSEDSQGYTSYEASKDSNVYESPPEESSESFEHSEFR
ncbi:hypothetical protein OIU85_019821 [Salix viminalis]|uniref:Uncharacterized protein n=1 Tax=Salix viminalis TaxID=40686 RepID=A0A9Q0UY61_SALVM|nr:hypothetical protein OIU85_019821 [Salix viminalis]